MLFKLSSAPEGFTSASRHSSGGEIGATWSSECPASKIGGGPGGGPSVDDACALQAAAKGRRSRKRRMMPPSGTLPEPTSASHYRGITCQCSRKRDGAR